MNEKYEVDKSNLLPNSSKAKVILGVGATCLGLIVGYQALDNYVHDRQHIGSITCEGDMQIQAHKNDSIYDIADEHAKRLGLNLKNNDKIDFNSIVISRINHEDFSQDNAANSADLVLNRKAILSLPTKCN